MQFETPVTVHPRTLWMRLLTIRLSLPMMNMSDSCLSLLTPPSLTYAHKVLPHHELYSSSKLMFVLMNSSHQRRKSLLSGARFAITCLHVSTGYYGPTITRAGSGRKPNQLKISHSEILPGQHANTSLSGQLTHSDSSSLYWSPSSKNCVYTYMPYHQPNIAPPGVNGPAQQVY